MSLQFRMEAHPMAIDKIKQSMLARNFDLALQEIDQQSSEFKESSEGKSLRALILIELNEIEKAVKILESVIQSEPGFQSAYVNLSLAKIRLAQWLESVNVLRTVIDAGTKISEAYRNMGISLIQLGRPAEAKPHLERALQLKPDYLEACLDLAVVYFALQDFAPAERIISEILKKHPDHLRAKVLQQEIQKIKGRS